MSDASAETAATSSAVVPPRPGGCVGTFFQLFDWTRMFAKKKLFSKRLLPPVRLKKASKKFGVYEKLPKHRLIADENSGGFPKMKKSDRACTVDSEQKHEMRTPGLVARLMGLEAMPAVQRDRLKKAALSGTGSNKGDKFMGGHGRFERQDLGVEKGESKHEPRPQKLQKTGMSERRPVTRFGAEALQLKSVLSGSRKQHPKLVSPVRSPRNLSGKNASRLIGAATRILEPGLQRSKSKCALTYSSALHQTPPTENLTQKPTVGEPLENFNYSLGATTAQNGQSSSCRNCARLPVKEFTAKTEEKPPVFSPKPKNACLSTDRNPTVPIFCPMREKGKDQGTSPFYTPFAMDGGQARLDCCMVENEPLDREDPRQWQANSPESKLQKDLCPSVGLKHKGLGQKQMLQQRDRLPLSSKLSRLQSSRVSTETNETRNFIALNRNLSNHTQLTMPAKMDSCQLDTDTKIGERRHDSLSPVRKRRTTNIARQNEFTSFVSSTFIKSTNGRSNAMPGKDTNSPCSKSRLFHLQESRNGDRGKNEIDIVSFTFNSQLKQKTGINAEVEERRKKNVSNCEIPVKKSAFQNSYGKRSLQRSCPWSGDSLGALLEQKLWELTCQDEGESTFGYTASKKTSTMILQELISALTAERPFQQDDLACKLKNQKNHLRCDDHQAEIISPAKFQSSQAKSKSTRNLVGCLQDREYLSPGSVLEASFSNDSCASSSLDDGPFASNAGHNLCAESTEFCDQRHSLEPDADVSDSATSLGMGKFYRESVISLLENISEVFSKINLADVLLKGGNLAHAKEVILNTEMVFGNAALPGAIVNGGFSIGPFVLNELETLAGVMLANFGGSVRFDDTIGELQLKGFVFDCVIEYLDSRFSRYSNFGFNAWTRLPLPMKTEMLIGDIVKEVGRWAELAGLIPEELIEYEMSHSLGKWTDFELEAFETGAEIDLEIFQTLIDELVIDCTFSGCWSNSLDIACC